MPKVADMCLKNNINKSSKHNNIKTSGVGKINRKTKHTVL